MCLDSSDVRVLALRTRAYAFAWLCLPFPVSVFMACVWGRFVGYCVLCYGGDLLGAVWYIVTVWPRAICKGKGNDSSDSDSDKSSGSDSEKSDTE
jgi:hypothetical protein